MSSRDNNSSFSWISVVFCVLRPPLPSSDVNGGGRKKKSGVEQGAKEKEKDTPRKQQQQHSSSSPSQAINLPPPSPPFLRFSPRFGAFPFSHSQSPLGGSAEEGGGSRRGAAAGAWPAMSTRRARKIGSHSPYWQDST